MDNSEIDKKRKRDDEECEKSEEEDEIGQEYYNFEDLCGDFEFIESDVQNSKSDNLERKNKKRNACGTVYFQRKEFIYFHEQDKKEKEEETSGEQRESEKDIDDGMSSRLDDEFYAILNYESDSEADYQLEDEEYDDYVWLNEEFGEPCKEKVKEIDGEYVLVANENTLRDDCVISLLKFVNKNQHISNIRVHRMDIFSRGAKCLAEFICQNTSIQKLDLWRNQGDQMKNEEVGIISASLGSNTTLKELVIRCNWMDDCGIVFISNALKLNSTVSKLNLRNNNIGAKGSIEIANVLKTRSFLKSLNLHGNPIGSIGNQHILESLNFNSSLTELNLGSTGMKYDQVKLMSQLLKTNNTITILSIANNSIDFNGANEISEMLKANSFLSILNMRDNFIRSKGAVKLSDALRINITLKILILDSNQISSNGISSLSDSLHINSSLCNLCLGGNNEIGEQEAIVLGNMLKKNIGLRKLDISGKDVPKPHKKNSFSRRMGEIGGKYIYECLFYNTFLEQLEINNNGIEEKTLVSIYKCASLKWHFILYSILRHVVPKDVALLIIGKGWWTAFIDSNGNHVFIELQSHSFPSPKVRIWPQV